MKTSKITGRKAWDGQLTDQNYEALLKALLPKKYQTADFNCLYQIQAHTKCIEIVVEDIRFSEFEEYTTHQILVEDSMRKIGSAIANLSSDLRERNPQTDWKTLDDIRDLVSQNIRTIDPTILWDYGTKKMPVVHEQISQIVDREFDMLK